MEVGGNGGVLKNKVVGSNFKQHAIVRFKRHEGWILQKRWRTGKTENQKLCLLPLSNACVLRVSTGSSDASNAALPPEVINQIPCRTNWRRVLAALLLSIYLNGFLSPAPCTPSLVKINRILLIKRVLAFTAVLTSLLSSCECPEHTLEGEEVKMWVYGPCVPAVQWLKRL